MEQWNLDIRNAHYVNQDFWSPRDPINEISLYPAFPLMRSVEIRKVRAAMTICKKNTPLSVLLGWAVKHHFEI